MIERNNVQTVLLKYYLLRKNEIEIYIGIK